MADKIFINYRRDNAVATAGRLHDRFSRVFGRGRVFIDVDTIPAGADFVHHLEKHVSECDVLLAVIGPGWLEAKDVRGMRRLDDPQDFVRIEIAAALKRNVLVIPVLIDGAPMPRADQLPDDLKALARRNAVEVRNTQFGGDADRLIAKVRETLNPAPSSARRWGPVALAAVLVLAGGVGLYLSGQKHGTPDGQPIEKPSVVSSKTNATLVDPNASAVRLDFSAGDQGTAPSFMAVAEPYLRAAPIAVSVDDHSPAGSLIVFKNNLGLYEGRAVAPTVSQNFLTQIETGNVPASFTLKFSQALDSVTFMVPKVYAATESGITFPAWSATALDSSGRVLSTASEGLTRRFGDVPARTYTLTAPGFEGISAVRFQSDPNLDGRPFAAFSALLIEQIVLDPR